MVYIVNYEDVGKNGHKHLMRIADAPLPKQPWRSSATQRTRSQLGQSLSKETPTQINEGEEDRENRQREENESGEQMRLRESLY